MTNLSKERLEKIASWRETYGADSNVMIPADEAEALVYEVLQRREAAKVPDYTRYDCGSCGYETLSVIKRCPRCNHEPIGVTPLCAALPALLELSGNSEQLRRDIQSRIDAAVKLLKQAAPEMLAVKDPDGALVGPLKANTPVAPDGWKWVPIEPTEEMVIDGFESEPDKFFSSDDEWESYAAMSGCEQAAHRARLCYLAMLAVAPQPDQFRDMNCLASREYDAGVFFCPARTGKTIAYATKMVSAAVRDVIAERQRQIEKKGYTEIRDDKYLPGVLNCAGAAYAVSVSFLPDANRRAQRLWPWPDAGKYLKSSPKEPRRALVKAAALIVAEIERIDRCAIQHDETGKGRTRRLIEPQAFQVDINGCWTHPDFPETDESWDEKRFSEWARQEGLESKLIFADVGEGDAIPTHWWELRKPKGEGWFVGSIHDTDEGLVCVWLRNAAAHQSGVVDHLGNC